MSGKPSPDLTRQLPLFELDRPGPPAAGRTVSAEASLELRDQISEFLVHLARVGRAGHTLAATRRDLDQVAEALGPRSVGEVAIADLRRFVDGLGRERANGTASLRRKVATVKAFFRYLRREGLLESDPSAPLTYPPPVERPAEPLAPDEVERFLGVPLAAGHHALLLLMLDAGLKREEVLALRGPDLVLGPAGERSVSVQRGLAAKRVRVRVVPLTPRLVGALEEVRPDAISDRPLFPLSTRGVDFIVREAARRAGVPRRGKLTPQRLRDTFAVRWLAERLPRERAAEVDDDRRGLEARHDRELAELLGLAPDSLAVARYRRAAELEREPAKGLLLPNA